MANQLAEEIAEQMRQTRARTLALFDMTRESDLHESPGFGFRPVIWHLAHIGVFEGYWLLQKLKGDSPVDERYERIFDPIKTPREESKSLPSRSEMENYLERVRKKALRYLNEADFDDSDPHLSDGYLFRLVLEHEQQHQETLCYLLQLLKPKLKTRPHQAILPSETEGSASVIANAGEMAHVSAGEFVMGSTWDAFAYDNELPPHTQHVPAFRIDKLLTTNEEYAQFIKEGGYLRSEFWSEEGWRWRERENWKIPLYWKELGEGWSVQTMFDEGALAAQHPVSGVSWYEAEAYARFRKKRLPTEVEWEKAASWDAHQGHKRRFSWGDEPPSERLCNFDNHYWGTTPVGSFPGGASAYDCLDMTGNVWEWTQDVFRGYKGFKAFPYPEYSETWFDEDHRVLKGGSWATRASVLRTSFRNFFRRHFRIGFAGIRCAADG